MGGTHFLQTGYLLLNRNAPSAVSITIHNFLTRSIAESVLILQKTTKK